jgi:hypothetical protein
LLEDSAKRKNENVNKFHTKRDIGNLDDIFVGLT